MRASPHGTELLIAFCTHCLCRCPMLCVLCGRIHSWHPSPVLLDLGAMNTGQQSPPRALPSGQLGALTPSSSPHLPISPASVTASHKGSYVSPFCVLFEDLNPNSASPQQIPGPNHPPAVVLEAFRSSKDHRQCKFGRTILR